jgi:hypothetical protein
MEGGVMEATFWWRDGDIESGIELAAEDLLTAVEEAVGLAHGYQEDAESRIVRFEVRE